jgi:tetratricopeptide (TPR) repeat protein
MSPEEIKDIPEAESAVDEHAAEVDAGAARRSRLVNISLAVLFIALPLLYFVFRSRDKLAQPPTVQAAAQTYIAALEANARNSPTTANRINLSLAYINGGASMRAIPVLLSVVADDKNNTIAWNDLCVARTLLKDYAEAIDNCNRALTIEPDFQLARNNLKWASDEKNKTLAAIAGAKQTTPVGDAAFYLDQGMNELHVGDYDQAIVSWQHTLQLDPKNAAAANNIGIAYMMKKRTAEAVVWFNKAIELDPGSQLAKNNLAWAHQEQQSPTPQP